jgi:DNA-binding PadR family transcriptional regulator
MKFEFWSHGCGPWDAAAGRGRWRWDEDFAGWFGGRHGHRKGGPFRRRVFEQGDLKYVILQLLDEKPRHGYEIIKALEERFGGAYTPSAGTVYPTLQLLEDLGYATVATEEGGKKIYSITDQGRAYLAENRSAVDDIFERIADFGSSFLSDSMMELNRAFGEAARAAYSAAARHPRDKDLVGKVRDVLRKAAQEIEELAKQARTSGEA